MCPITNKMPIRRDRPHARLTALMPPAPHAIASLAAVIRRVRSSNMGHTLRSRTFRAARASIQPQRSTHRRPNGTVIYFRLLSIQASKHLSTYEPKHLSTYEPKTDARSIIVLRAARPRV